MITITSCAETLATRQPEGSWISADYIETASRPIRSEKMAPVLVNHAAKQNNGKSQNDIIGEAICLEDRAVPGSTRVALETFQPLISDPKIASKRESGKAGFDLTEQTVVDLVDLIGAIPWELSSAVIDPKTAVSNDTLRTTDFLNIGYQSGLYDLLHNQGTKGNLTREYAL